MNNTDNDLGKEQNISSGEGERRRLTSAERQALYAERAASKSGPARIRRRRRRIIIVAVSVLALAGIIAGAIGLSSAYKTKILPGRRYAQALALAEEKKYYEAADILLSLGDYSDAVSLAAGYESLGAKQASGLDDPLVLDKKSAPWFSIDEEGVLSFDKDLYRGDGHIEIPAVFERVAVRTIGDRFFFYADYLLSVKIPETVTRIGERAFFRCESIESVTLPDSVEEIAGSAFTECTSLKEINFGKGLKSIGDRAFKRCDALTVISFPEGFESIGPYAFNGCASLKKVNLPASLSVLSNYAFTGCTAIEEVTFPGTRERLAELCSGEDGVIILNAATVTTAD